MFGNWNSVASSADGANLVAAFDRSIYTSTNSGWSWTEHQVGDAHVNSFSVASSSDGQRPVALPLTSGPAENFPTSINGANTWDSEATPGGAGQAFLPPHSLCVKLAEPGDVALDRRIR